MLPKIRTFDFH